MARARRDKGSGSLYYDAARERWIGSLEAGWTSRGTRRRLTVSAKTKRECAQKLRAKEREVAIAGIGAEGLATGATVKTWAEAWLDTRRREIRPTSFTADRSQVRTWIIPAIGHKRLDRLSPGDVRAVRRAVLDAGRAVSTAERAHAVLKKMLADAAAEGHAVPANVRDVKGIRSGPRRATRSRDAIDAADAALLLAEAARRDDGARWMVALLEGIRPAEALGLTWAAIDFGAGKITVEWQLRRLPYNVARDRASGFRVPDGYEARRLHDAAHLVRPKTDHGFRVIPLLAPVADALKRWRAVAPPSPHGLVFPSVDGKQGRGDKDDRAAWVALQDAAQVAWSDGPDGGRYDLYECRHTTATLLLAAGVDSATIVAVMGHASILSTKAYLHTDVERAREALTRATAHLLTGAPSGP